MWLGKNHDSRIDFNLWPRHQAHLGRTYKLAMHFPMARTMHALAQATNVYRAWLFLEWHIDLSQLDPHSHLLCSPVDVAVLHVHMVAKADEKSRMLPDLSAATTSEAVADRGQLTLRSTDVALEARF